MLFTMLVVALGGGIGTVLRYLVSCWAVERFGPGFPYGTLLVNIAGCLVIGAFMVLVTEQLIASPEWRLFVTTGFLGGLTTFSSFSYETMKLLHDGNTVLAAYNVLANCGIGFFATWAGMQAARYLLLSSL